MTNDLLARVEQIADAIERCQYVIGPAESAQILRDLMQEVRHWQPIETAPKDGTEILLTDGHYRRTGWSESGG